MRRHETRIGAIDVESGQRRFFRLDRIEQAEVINRG